jgi:hypothetical protein
VIRLLSVFLLASSAYLQAQPVRAPHAQALIDALMKEHPEMQTIGLHVTPPGQTENVNIAGSKPGKVGKRSAPIDMEVQATGKPSLRMANLGAFDIGVPIGDAKGRGLGMIVVVIPAARAENADDAVRQVLAIRDILQSRIESREALFVGATIVDSPLVMVAQTPLPGVRGGFSRLGIDLAGDRLYAVAKENNSTEVFDLQGEHITSESGNVMPLRVVANNGPRVEDAAGHLRFEGDSFGKIRVVELATGRTVSALQGSGETGDITFDNMSRCLFITGSKGIVVFQQLDASHYRLITRFNTMGGSRSIYEPSKKLFYIIHGNNAEDSAGLQVYEVKN